MRAYCKTCKKITIFKDMDNDLPRRYNNIRHCIICEECGEIYTDDNTIIFDEEDYENEEEY